MIETRSMLLNGSLMNHDPLKHIKSSLKDPRVRYMSYVKYNILCLFHAKYDNEIIVRSEAEGYGEEEARGLPEDAKGEDIPSSNYE